MDVSGLIEGWDSQTQMVFLVCTLWMLSLLLLCLGIGLMRTVRIVIRGYPPVVTPVPEPQECNHSENLKGVCLKPGGCKTVDECDRTVQLAGEVKDEV